MFPLDVGHSPEPGTVSSSVERPRPTSRGGAHGGREGRIVCREALLMDGVFDRDRRWLRSSGASGRGRSRNTPGARVRQTGHSPGNVPGSRGSLRCGRARSGTRCRARPGARVRQTGHSPGNVPGAPAGDLRRGRARSGTRCRARPGARVRQTGHSPGNVPGSRETSLGASTLSRALSCMPRRRRRGAWWSTIVTPSSMCAPFQGPAAREGCSRFFIKSARPSRAAPVPADMTRPTTPSSAERELAQALRAGARSVKNLERPEPRRLSIMRRPAARTFPGECSRLPRETSLRASTLWHALGCTPRRACPADRTFPGECFRLPREPPPRASTLWRALSCTPRHAYLQSHSPSGSMGDVSSVHARLGAPRAADRVRRG